MSKHLLWIGAGAAQSFDFDYSEYSKVIFVDPLVQIASQEQFSDKAKFVTVQKAVITETVSKQPFKLFNNEEFSSFLEPTGLKEIYPNLMIEEVLDVETVSIIELIKELQVTGSENSLFLDLPCLSLEILNELKSNDILSLFQQIYVCAGKKPLFSSESDINSITELLNNAFYQFVSEWNSDTDVCTHQFEFNPLLESVHIQKAEILDLKAQIKLVVNTHQDLESDKEELKTLLTNSQIAFNEVQAELNDTHERVLGLEKQKNFLDNEKEMLQAEISQLNEIVLGQKLATDEMKSQLQSEQQKAKRLQETVENLHASEKVYLDEIKILESDLQSVNDKVESRSKQVNDLKLDKENLEGQLLQVESDLSAKVTTVERLESQLLEELSKSKQLTERIESLTAEIQVKSKSIASLETKLSSVSDNATVEIDTLTKDNEKLTFALAEEKARADKAHANEQSLKATLSEQESRNKQTSEAYENELQELKTKLKESEEKQKETYGWFASRKQQAEALTEELEVLKRENALLASNNETALAVSELESKLTAMLNKQNEDSIEIANALGKHVTRCHEEQKSNIASQFELRKLTGFSRIPISTNSYDMDSANLAELSSLVSQNTYDVIIEFGCGLSTIVSASTLQDKADRGFNNGKYLEDKGNNSEIEKALPKHIVGFEQSSERLKETTGLLSNAGVEAYVDLCHAPLISVAHTDNAKGGELFYDCTEKLLELKRILNNLHANILVVINGPFLDDDNKAKYWALPLVLDYFSQADITVFTNGTNSEQISDLIPQWEDECERRQLTLNVKKLKTPKGVTILTIQS